MESVVVKFVCILRLTLIYLKERKTIEMHRTGLEFCGSHLYSFVSQALRRVV